tara:strand:+ start:2819 stop:2932 length:114 start_codon:yes stop_codon:yes gene_type:complete
MKDFIVIVFIGIVLYLALDEYAVQEAIEQGRQIQTRR